MLQIYMELNPGYNPAALGYHLFGVFNGDAGTWLDIARNNGFDIIDHPEEGTVLVTPSHVANVERYDEGEGWLISESGYDTLPAWNLHYSLYFDGSNWRSAYASSSLVLGFIKIPGAGPGPGPTPPHRKMPFIYYLKNWNNEVY